LAEVSADPKRLVAFNNVLRKTCYVRRKKIDVLSELPEKRWVKLVVEGEKRKMAEYRAAGEDIVLFLAKRAKELVSQNGGDLREQMDASWKAALRAESAQYLVAITHLRRLALEAKKEAVYEWVEQFKDTGRKLVAFGWHREPLLSLAEKYGCGLVIGGLSDQEKQEVIDDFQDSEGKWLIGCSLKSGGVGITLTQASDVLFIEQGWNPADMDQAVDRCHRIGQKNSVTGWVTICADTIDEDIVELIEQKRKMFESIVDGRSADQDGGSVFADLIVRLAQKI